MGHDHGHHHHGHGDGFNYNKAFALGIVLNLGFVVAETVFGIFAHSLALLADAGHNLSDVLGLVLAWGANALAQRRPSQRHTYGLRRTTILAALVNAVVLLLVTGGIIWEAIRRFMNPEPVVGSTVIWVAAAGVLVNGATAMLLMSGRHHDLNVRGAFLHMVADAAVSLGVVVSGFIILNTGWLLLDPAMSIVIALVIAWGTWHLLTESLNLALDAVPAGIDCAAVEKFLGGLPGVVALHDLHIWGMSTTESALTVHLVVNHEKIDDCFLAHICHELHDDFHIGHSTIQIETGDAAHPCHLKSDDGHPARCGHV